MAGIEDIFLAYANHSLIDNPENFYKIFEEVDHYFQNTITGHMYVKEIIKGILTFVKYNDLSWIESLHKLGTKRKLFNNYTKRVFEISREAVYGYRDNFCEDKCFYRIDRRERFDKKFFSGLDRLKCYECGQSAFICMLADLVQGKEYSEMIDLGDLLAMQPLRRIMRVDRASERSPLKEGLKEDVVLDIDSPLGWGKGDVVNCKFMFQKFLNKFISYSLIEFLQKNDRRKIKRCPFCGTFFIARDIKRKRCYDNKECEKKYQRLKKRKQRKEEPEIYD